MCGKWILHSEKTLSQEETDLQISGKIFMFLSSWLSFYQYKIVMIKIKFLPKFKSKHTLIAYDWLEWKLMVHVTWWHQRKKKNAISIFLTVVCKEIFCWQLVMTKKFKVTINEVCFDKSGVCVILAYKCRLFTCKRVPGRGWQETNTCQALMQML